MDQEHLKRDMELLAPAGSFEAFKAAVENGANAIYLGGKSFNARASAANFDLEALKEAVKYAHDRHVKIYVAVNILIADSEFIELADYIYSVFKIGADAVILQDIGAADMIRTILPELEIHASTQMTVNNRWGVKHLESLGFKRVVLARETSAGEMRAISQATSLEIEVFIHGALCISYSGQCLMSSFIGGRSGNRGTCAQPCRMSYQLVTKDGKDVLAESKLGEHLLSPKDLNLVHYLGILQESGVDSLKVEGRMKRPEYVATVIRIYREALNNLKDNKYERGLISEEEFQELTQIFNRDFTQGYLEEHPGAELMSFSRPNNRGTRLGRVAKIENGKLHIKLEGSLRIGDGLEIWTSKGREGIRVDKLWVKDKKREECLTGETAQLDYTGQAHPGDRIFKTHDEKLIEKARLSFQEGKEKRKRPLSMLVGGSIGEKLRLEVREGEKAVVVLSSTEAQNAQKRPLNRELLLQQLGRLGTTPFWLEKLETKFVGDIMIPVKELNEMRRTAVEKLLSEDIKVPILEQSEYRRRYAKWNAGLGKKQREKGSGARIKPQLSVAVSNLEALHSALKAGTQRVLLSGELWRSRTGFKIDEVRTGTEFCKKVGAEAVWVMPRILNQEQSNWWYKELTKAAQWDVRPTIMAGNIGQLEILRAIDPNWDYETDYSLNVFNKASLAYFAGQGAKRVTLSPELNHEQLRTLTGISSVEMIVFGDMEMMISEYCPVGAALGEKKGDHCKSPCTEDIHFLKDRLNYNFPIETDRYCRMHLFNSKRLNLYDELNLIASMGISSIRLQLIRESSNEIYRIVKVFNEGLNRMTQKSKQTMDEGKALLDSIFPEGFTKGHFFRGVI